MREGSARTFVRGSIAVVGLLFVAAAPARAAAEGPIAGENVNMVSGKQWPGGDPFLQRQNEPSIAVSTANPNHLLAGANDYRTVDLSPAVDKVVGDAWLGLFKSFDGGRTWQSVLVPGYPQDGSPEGLASPLKGLSTAADPVVRAGTDGLFYYSGIAFNRGTSVGKVFVARFVDRNDKENGDVTLGRDPIKYLDARAVDAGSAGQFLDKPWLATDVPRAGAGTCVLPGTPATSVQAGNVYLAYAEFTGRNDTVSKVMFSRSLDCGATWSAPQKLSESVHVNQGTAVAVDPLTGAVWVVWRRFASAAQDPAVMWVRSTDSGQTFTKPAVLAPLANAFDQGYPATGPAYGFRTNAFPSIAISTDGVSSWVHVAWAQRATGDGDARVVLSTWNGTAWSAPAAVDAGALRDGAGNAFARGHQLMPSLTFSQGRLMLLWYDTRLDHTHRLYAPDQSCLRLANDGECLEYVSPLKFPFHREEQIPIGELPADWTSPLVQRVFNPWIQDVYTENGVTRPLQIRHTLDVRVASAAAGPAPAFASVPVSQFPFGSRGDEAPDVSVTGFGAKTVAISQGGFVKQLQQLQYNPPNFWLFKGGTVPFMGDYVDINGRAFVQDPVTRRWTFDWRPTPTPVFHAMWTSNQDVRPPADGDWTNYTPISSDGSTTSLWDGSARRSCVPGQAGMRNQNVYTSRITEGLRVSSPQNVKRLPADRAIAFVVVAENATDRELPVTFQVQATAPGVRASFANDDGPELRTIQAKIAGHSSVSRSVFVSSPSDPAASVAVTVTSDAGAQGSATLNPAGTAAALAQPDGAPSLAGGEVYTASIESPNVVNPNVVNPNVVNPNVVNPNVVNPNVVNPNVVNPNVVNPNVVNPNVVNPNVVNPNVVNPNVVNASITSAPVSDATYAVRNGSNTTHSFHVKIVGTATAPSPLQAIVTRTYTTPDAQGCELVEQQHGVVVSSAPDVSGAIVPPTDGNLGDPNVADGATSNLTFTLAPGQEAQLTLRGLIPVEAMKKLVTEIAPVVVPHAGASCGAPPCFAAPLFVRTATLPGATVGVPYSALLSAVGGTGAPSWSATGLPGGLSLSSAGAFSGTPTVGGTFTILATVTDGAHAATRAIPLGVARAAPVTSLTSSPNPSDAGAPVTFTATVAAPDAPGVTPTGVVTFAADALVADGACGPVAGQLVCTWTTSAIPPGRTRVTATYAGDANLEPAAPASLFQSVNGLATTTTVTASPAGASTFGTGVVTVTVRGSAVLAQPPLGDVTLRVGAETLALRLSALGCVPEGGPGPGAFACSVSTTLTRTAPGGYRIDADYGGNTVFLSSTSPVIAHTIVKATPTITFEPVETGTGLPAGTVANPAIYGQRVNTTFVVSGPPAATFPTGAFRWTLGGAPIGSCANPVGGGVFTCGSVGVRLGSGTRTYTAVYDGDANYEAVTSDFPFVIDPATPTVVLSVTQASTGGPVTFDVTITPPYPPVGSPSPGDTMSGIARIWIGDPAAPTPLTMDVLNDPSGTFATGTRTVVVSAGLASFSASFEPSTLAPPSVQNFTAALSAPVVFRVVPVP